MFERFTDRSRRVLMQAQNEAVEARQFIGGHHLLIALAAADGGLAAAALGEVGLTVASIKEAVARAHPPGPEIDTADALAAIGIDASAVAASVNEAFPDGHVNVPSSERPAFDVDAKKILENSLRQSVALESGFLGTEHLLLGLLVTPKNSGASVLRDLGVDTDALRDRVIELATPTELR